MKLNFTKSKLVGTHNKPQFLHLQNGLSGDNTYKARSTGPSPQDQTALILFLALEEEGAGIAHTPYPPFYGRKWGLERSGLAKIAQEGVGTAELGRGTTVLHLRPALPCPYPHLLDWC